MEIPHGYLVAIEGTDAVGKNTNSLLLSRWLKLRGVKTALMSFPDYGTPIGKQIKSFLSGRKSYPIELQHLLFAANRWEKYNEILAHLNAGELVIVDRYTESNIAYGMANGLDHNWLANLEKGLPKADVVIVLDAPLHSLVSRRPRRTKDAYERSSTLQARAQKAYRELARKHDWKVIEADEPVERVQASMTATVREALKRDRGTSI